MTSRPAPRGWLLPDLQQLGTSGPFAVGGKADSASQIPVEVSDQMFARDQHAAIAEAPRRHAELAALTRGKVLAVVKATRARITAPFFLSANVLRHAREHPEAYSVYRVFDLGPNPRFYKLSDDIKEILDLTPVSYGTRR
jgi:Domain of unknown function (DUF3883)